MNISAPFISRPVATTLLTLGVALAGGVAFFLLPVSPLPQVDFPTISVQASLPGASPETMATSVATPLERHLGQIADVTEMTSTSAVGSTNITLQFGLDRDIDGAARDVQAGINAARADLPAALKSNPTYRKVNPADAPIMILALTSKTLSQGQLYDSASTILEQKLSQVNGIGQVIVGGSSLPAVRAELNPYALFKYGIGLEDVRAALSAANANSPKGFVEQGTQRFQIYANDQARTADQYRNLVVAYRDNAPVRLSDIADVQNSVEDIRNLGLYNGNPSVLVILFRQPGANIIDTVDRVYSLLPLLNASIPAAIDLNVVMDRTTTIRASLHDVERTLLIAICLVIGVVFLFLRNARAALIPSIAVPVSLIGTFGIMYLLGYSLDNLSLMALIIATGFVVDDAIVVLENTSRHIEAGMPRMQATILGAKEVSFTVLSMSLSLVAVFLPILLMGGIVGRLFREFAVTLSVAIIVSLIVSLTTTPMMCSRILKPEGEETKRRHPWLAKTYAASEKTFDKMQGLYERTLKSALANGPIVMLILLITICLNIYLFLIVPKGFFPQQDTGRLMGNIQADQSISFQLMKPKLYQFVKILNEDPAIDNVVAFTGGSQINSARAFVSLKPLSERNVSADQVITRLRGKLANIPGAPGYLQAVQDIRVGGRMSNAQYQYTLQADDLNELRTWAQKLTDALKKDPGLADVNSDQQDKGLETEITFDRNTVGRTGLNLSQVDNTLYDAFGQRQVSVIYNPLNQYHVIMEVAPQFWQSPDSLQDIWVSTSGGALSGTQSSGPASGTSLGGNARGQGGTTISAASVANDAARNAALNSIAVVGHGSASTGAAISTATETVVPLMAFSKYGPGTTALAVNHQGHFAAATISFNLPEGKSLSDAQQIIADVSNQIGMPVTVHGSFQGTAQAYEQSVANEPILILAALLAVYIVLGVLYESYVHPITILSTLPSAGVGAVLGILICKKLFYPDLEFDIIGLIGVILLIGIVKKNAIMMIDFALSAERTQGLNSRDAIYQACLLRFRPIMMTTMAALFGALPLAFGLGDGAELRRPLGITIVGGLLVSQMLTLFTTPVVYLYFDRFSLWSRHNLTTDYLKNYPARHWNGELPIIQSFWLSGFFRALIMLPVSMVLIAAVYSSNNLQSGKIINPLDYIKLAPLGLAIVFELLEVTTFTWWAVGNWRAFSRHYAVKKTVVCWIVKAIIVLGFLGVFSQLLILADRIVMSLTSSSTMITPQR